MKMKLLGYDGLSSDETATAYYADGEKLIAILWGHAEEKQPIEAVHFLYREADNAAQIQDYQRANAMQKTITNIREIFPIVCQRCARKNISPVTIDGLFVCGTCYSRIARRINRREGRR
jgi:hypothetical protein